MILLLGDGDGGESLEMLKMLEEIEEMRVEMEKVGDRDEEEVD